jgi:ribose-phosphate pyrophosphokinase
MCDHLNLPVAKGETEVFPDDELIVKVEEDVRGKDCFVVQSTCTPVDTHLMELLIYIDCLRRASAKRITAVIPYFGYARQDRKDEGRVPITAKLVANLITAAGADRVLCMELHAAQIQGFFDIPVDHLYASTVFYEYLKNLPKENLIVVSPDVGGVKMAAAYAGMLETGVGFVAKRRRSSTTVEATNIVGDVEGTDVLIVDDITETAGTLVAAARLLREEGARSVRAAVTHSNLQKMAYERLESGLIDELITTDSIPVDTRGLPIKVLSVAPLLGEAIVRINGNESVTSLFRIKGF